EDDARFARGTRLVRGPRRRWRLVRAVPAAQDERPAVVVGRVLAHGAAHRSMVAWLSLRVVFPKKCRREVAADSGIRSMNMKRLMVGVVCAAVAAWSTVDVLGFCGFYVSKADAKLFNKASQVVLVRDGDRTVLTMV